MTQTPTTEQTEMMKYLLDEMSAEEREVVEERYFLDDDYFFSLATLEHDLIDRYVTNRLPADEKQRFEKSLAKYPARREQIAEARVLQRYIQDHKAQTAADTREAQATETAATVIAPVPKVAASRQPFGAWLKDLFGLNALGWQYAATGAMLLLTVGGIGLGYRTYQLNQELARARNNGAVQNLTNELNRSQESLRALEAQLTAAEQQNVQDAEEQKKLQNEVQQAKTRSEQLAREIERLKQGGGNRSGGEAPPELAANISPLNNTRGGGCNGCSAVIKPGSRTAVIAFPLPPEADSTEYEIKIGDKLQTTLKTPADRVLRFSLPARNLSFTVEGKATRSGDAPYFGVFKLDVKTKH